MREKEREANDSKSAKYQQMVGELGQDGFVNFKQKYYNKKLADIVLNRNEINKVYHTQKRLIQKKDPVFMEPTSNFGRAHLYAPIKIINNTKVDTLWYNIILLWVLSGLLYLALLFDLLRKGLKYLQSLNFRERYFNRKRGKIQTDNAL